MHGYYVIGMFPVDFGGNDLGCGSGSPDGDGGAFLDFADAYGDGDQPMGTPIGDGVGCGFGAPYVPIDEETA